MASGAQACKMGAPPWGTWYRKQAKAFAAQASKPGHIVVAWALGDGKRGYVYGVFESMARFYEYLRETRPVKRVGFEIIREGTACLLYLDVEWLGDADREHAGIRRLCLLLREHCREKHGWQALRLWVTCGSRAHDDGYKNSYHVHANVCFCNNHNGDMKAFVEDYVRTKLSGAEWTWKRKSGEAESWVDMRVYTKNRLKRPPGNCKPGQPPHVRISGDPTDEGDVFCSSYKFEDPESWHPCIVSGAAGGDDVYTGPQRAPLAHGSVFKQGRKRKREAGAADVAPDRAVAPCTDAASELPGCVRNALLAAESICAREPVKNFPPCIKMQIQHNFVGADDIVQLRVSRPGLCAPRYFCPKKERHAHSSNGCLVLVVHQRQPELVKLLGGVQVYVKCFCEKEPSAAFGLLGVEDKRLKELPRYDAPGAPAEYLRYVVETEHGIDTANSVLDVEARRTVRRVYKLGQAERTAKMRDPKLKVAWAHVFACNGGWRPWPLPTTDARDFFGTLPA